MWNTVPKSIICFINLQKVMVTNLKKSINEACILCLSALLNRWCNKTFPHVPLHRSLLCRSNSLHLPGHFTCVERQSEIGILSANRTTVTQLSPHWCNYIISHWTKCKSTNLSLPCLHTKLQYFFQLWSKFLLFNIYKIVNKCKYWCTVCSEIWWWSSNTCCEVKVLS